MTELCTSTATTCAGAGLCASVAPLRPGLASERELQQAQPLADRLFGMLIALPFIFGLEARPLIGIDRFQIQPPELAIGRGLRRQQGRIRPANPAFLHLRVDGRLGRLCRFRRGSGRASAQRGQHGKRGCHAARDPQSFRKMIRHHMVGPNC